MIYYSFIEIHAKYTMGLETLDTHTHIYSDSNFSEDVAQSFQTVCPGTNGLAIALLLSGTVFLI